MAKKPIGVDEPVKMKRKAYEKALRKPCRPKCGWNLVARSPET